MHKTKILLIDDEVIVLKAYARELESFGHAVYTASRGKEAIKIAQKEKPDIVFTDMVMPEMDGVEVCRKIKEMYSDTEVILISGYPEEVIEKESGFFAAGGRKDWLKKPLEIDELQRQLRKLSWKSGPKTSLKNNMPYRAFPDRPFHFNLYLLPVYASPPCGSYLNLCINLL